MSNLTALLKLAVSKVFACFGRKDRRINFHSKGSLEGYPNTYQGDANQEQIERLQILDPALIHFPRAFRLSDPILQDPEIKHQWLNARRQVISHLLQIINSSRWNDRLVLRGSLLLKAWLGEIAREPGDIDWVFRPQSVGLKDPLSEQLFDDLIQKVSERPQVGNVTIEIAKISTDDIWTYQRAQGRRIVFPWKAANLPAGALQIDVVFGEQLLSAPIQTIIPLSEGNSTLIWSASKELSLAWKLLWLVTDIYTQGKDLYDATILAEQTQLSFNILYQILQSNKAWQWEMERKPDFSWESDFSSMIEIDEEDWDTFKLEYPWIEGEAGDWQARLSQALAPTFANLDGKRHPINFSSDDID